MTVSLWTIGYNRSVGNISFRLCNFLAHEVAALPQHSAERLCLSGAGSFISSRLRLMRRRSRTVNKIIETVSQRLTAMGCGKPRQR